MKGLGTPVTLAVAAILWLASMYVVIHFVVKYW